MIESHRSTSWLPQSGVVGMVTAASIWGSWVLFLAPLTLPGIFVTPVTSLSGALVLLTLVVASGGFSTFTRMIRDRQFVGMIGRVALLEVMQNTMFIVSFSLAIQDGGSVIIPIIRSLAGVITPLLAVLSSHETFSYKNLLYGSLASVGAVIVLTQGGIEIGENLSYLALGLVTASVILRSAYYIGQRRVAQVMQARKEVAMHVLTCHMSISASLLLPVLLAYIAFGPRVSAPNPGEQILYIGFFGITHVAFASLLRLRSMRELSAQQTIIIMYIEPAMSVLLSILFLGEAVTPGFFIGAALILFSAGAASLQTRR